MNSQNRTNGVQKIEIRRQHADVNAAENILAAGLAVIACRETATPAGVAVTLKQEPAGNREELLLQPI